MRFEIHVGSIFFIEAILLTRPQHPCLDKMFCRFPPTAKDLWKWRSSQQYGKRGKKEHKVRCKVHFNLLYCHFLSGCTISTSEREEILRTYIVTPTTTAGPIFDHSWGRELALLNGRNVPWNSLITHLTCRLGGEFFIVKLLKVATSDKRGILWAIGYGFWYVVWWNVQAKPGRTG